MKLNLYQIDAFTDNIFGGNPACVVPLDNWLADDILLKIAKENAVAETAFSLITAKEYICAGLHPILKWTYVVMLLLPQPIA